MNKIIAFLFVALAVPAFATITDWQDGSIPAFYAFDVTPGVYDIGEFSGAVTYEFMVNSNPDETQPSMALIGTLAGENGPARAGLKYEQWQDTGTYGATLFGVADFDSGVATAPGEDTHLAFVSEDGEIDLYVNGIYQATMPLEVTLSGIVGIGTAIRADESFVDEFDGEIYAVAIYDTALTDCEILEKSNRFFIPEPATMLLLGLGSLTLIRRRNPI